jgi:hypothetical protein
MMDFATLFDKNYLPQGLALHQSLQERVSDESRLFVLALDDEVSRYFAENNPGDPVVFPLADVEAAFPELLQAKANRTAVEYYFTLSPYLPLYIFRKYDEVERITTLDADIYFFDDPGRIFDAYPGTSVLITPHRFSRHLSHLEIYGRYNVSFQSFRRDKRGLACLEQWRRDCFGWCYDRLDDGNRRFADQKYLDSWKEMFPGVEEITLPGTGLAPWNLADHTVSAEGKRFLVDGEPLIYYHFHKLRTVGNYFAAPRLGEYGANIRLKPVRKMYFTYLKALKFLSRRIGSMTFAPKRDALARLSPLKRLLLTDGYWLYTSFFIIPVNVSRSMSRLRRSLNPLWPN